jgi:hypothetical protein
MVQRPGQFVTHEMALPQPAPHQAGDGSPNAFATAASNS